MVIQNQYFNQINRISGNSSAQPARKPAQSNGGFDNILQDTLKKSAEVKLSKHAELRLQERNIKLTDAQQQKIRQAVDKAEQKGVRDSLVLVDDIAMVVNVRNRTVITVVGSGELKDNVFTNIDGAVIA